MLNIIGHIVENNKEIHICGYFGEKILFQAKAGQKMNRRKLKVENGRFTFTHDKKKYYINDDYVKMHTLV